MPNAFWFIPAKRYPLCFSLSCLNRFLGSQPQHDASSHHSIAPVSFVHLGRCSRLYEAAFRSYCGPLPKPTGFASAGDLLFHGLCRWFDLLVWSAVQFRDTRCLADIYISRDPTNNWIECEHPLQSGGFTHSFARDDYFGPTFYPIETMILTILSRLLMFLFSAYFHQWS
jgi:hypothetical protein